MIVLLIVRICKVRSIAVLLLVVAGARGRASGAHEDACETMDPGHGVPARSTALPYSLLMDTHKITSDGCVYFTIRARPPSSFAGFMVQARGEREERAVGMFTEGEDIKLMECFGVEDNTATHVDDSPKQEVTMRWVPDSGYSGKVVFHATVARSKEEFWVRQKAKLLTVFKAKA